MEYLNFIEIATKEEANRVDLDKYSFIKLSESRGYCFKLRAKVPR